MNHRKAGQARNNELQSEFNLYFNFIFKIPCSIFDILSLSFSILQFIRKFRKFLFQLNILVKC